MFPSSLQHAPPVAEGAFNEHGTESPQFFCLLSHGVGLQNIIFTFTESPFYLSCFFSRCQNFSDLPSDHVPYLQICYLAFLFHYFQDCHNVTCNRMYSVCMHLIKVADLILPEILMKTTHSKCIILMVKLAYKCFP